MSTVLSFPPSIVLADCRRMASEQHQLPAEAAVSSPDSSVEDQDEKQPAEQRLVENDELDVTYPEGGARAWAVAGGTAGIAFCTLGYVNSFGYSFCCYPYVMLMGTNNLTESTRAGTKLTSFVATALRPSHGLDRSRPSLSLVEALSGAPYLISMAPR